MLLSSAGFFLITEFFIDILAASIVLRRSQDRPWLRRCAYLSVFLLAGLIIGFLMISPEELGKGVDIICICLMGLVGLFVAIHKSPGQAVTMMFIPESDSIEIGTAGSQI